MSKNHEQALPESDAPLDTSAPSNYSEIGDRIAGVFSAAEAAAEEIRAEARREAEEILRIAYIDADTARASAASHEADIHAAADAYAMERRGEAEQQVRQQLADAEAKARATREAAEGMAMQVEEAGRKRQLALHDEARSVEEGLLRTLQELRRMTVQLEALVGTPAARAGNGDESLVEALLPYSVVGADES